MVEWKSMDPKYYGEIVFGDKTIKIVSTPESDACLKSMYSLPDDKIEDAAVWTFCLAALAPYGFPPSSDSPTKEAQALVDSLFPISGDQVHVAALALFLKEIAIGLLSKVTDDLTEVGMRIEAKSMALVEESFAGQVPVQ